MGYDVREIIINNLQRDENEDINNEIKITLPDRIFSGKVENIKLVNMVMDIDTELLGHSNSKFKIAYPSTATYIDVTINLSFFLATIPKSDEDIALAISTSINNSLGTTVFNVFYNNIIINNNDVYRDNSNLLCNYTIYTTNGVAFNLDFKNKDSIGPIIGFGNGIYENSNTYTGGNIQSAGEYESIKISNSAYNTNLKLYDQLTDINCKLDLYDSENQLIENYLDNRDTTISLPIVNGYIYNINDFINYLEVEFNRYSSNFDDSIFEVEFNYDTYKFTISNSKNKKFGIGFRFDRGDGRNNYGSLHRILGFNKKNYLGVKSITSTKEARIFQRSYISDYILVYSDLVEDNYDTSVVLSGGINNSSMYETLFTIPLRCFNNYLFYVNDKADFTKKINTSYLAKLYNEDIDKDKTISFYIRLSSGRHIKLNSQWDMKLFIEYKN